MFSQPDVESPPSYIGNTIPYERFPPKATPHRRATVKYWNGPNSPQTRVTPTLRRPGTVYRIATLRPRSEDIRRAAATRTRSLNQNHGRNESTQLHHIPTVPTDQPAVSPARAPSPNLRPRPHLLLQPPSQVWDQRATRERYIRNRQIFYACSLVSRDLSAFARPPLYAAVVAQDCRELLLLLRTLWSSPAPGTPAPGFLIQEFGWFGKKRESDRGDIPPKVFENFGDLWREVFGVVSSTRSADDVVIRNVLKIEEDLNSFGAPAILGCILFRLTHAPAPLPIF
ncbi:unnamed protein product [Parascedosporium putredinis]|uniref:Uncharacterized protein n=1 Tax=Parascedosporium putredinis TaxID=1442378 RepID=A0A9P1M872_9PEZI|nr:unnamed protein product [Parascedosporium putredinis]CAI7993064.1 unnamed protein product [Parascedosporium putredinis]